MPAEEPDTRAMDPTVSHDEPTTAGHGVDAAATRQAEAIPAPQRLGRFSIVRTLGRGGMGTVYLALDARTKKQVALKVIPAGPDADPNDLARFKAEAEAVERLDHPNIVKLYEIGDVDGQAYISMEYVDGGNLAQRLKEVGAFPPKEAARIVESLARAVHYSHEHGVVHRDLKPSNILLGSKSKGSDSKSINPETGNWNLEPKLADFGLAKQLDKSLRLTRTGIAIGTPHYMAPEQARGWSDQIGPSTDVYGIGAILYELLVGHPPFSGSSPLETMELVVRKKPIRPSHLRNGIPPDLEAICLKCLEKAQGDRYQDAKAVADDLQHLLKGEPITEVPTRRDRIQRRRGLLLMVGGSLILAALAATAGWYLTQRTHKERLATATKDERKARLKAAIALCEDDQIRRGLAMMPKAEDDGLPIAEVFDAWNERVPKKVIELPHNKAAVAALSQRRGLLATAEGGTVRVWESANWTPLGEPWHVEGIVTALGWSEDGNQLAIGTDGGQVFIGSSHTGQLEAKPLGERKNGPIVAVRFTMVGVRVILGGERLSEEIVSPSTSDKPMLPAAFQFDLGPIAIACIAPGTRDVAAITSTGAIRIFDTNEARWRDLPPGGDATALAYSADANVLAVGTQAGRVRLWDAVSRTPLSEGFELGESVTAVAVRMTETEYHVVAIGSEGKGVVLQIGRPFVAPPIRLPNKAGNEVLGVAFSGNESLFVTSPFGVSRWRIWDAKRYGPDQDYSSSKRFGKPGSQDARFSTGMVAGQDGSILVGGSGGRMFVVNSTSDETSTIVPGEQDMTEVTAAAVSKHGQTACACIDKSKRESVVRHWSGSMNDVPKQHRFQTTINQQAYLSDGTAIALACGDNFVHIWDPVSDQDRAKFDCRSPVLAVATSETHILAGCADGSARLWNLETGGQELVVYHRSEVRAVAFHKGEILTASADGTAQRWHIPTGLPIGPALRHPDAISAIATQGDLVTTGGRGRNVRVWRLP